jgi:hypothetical protein
LVHYLGLSLRLRHHVAHLLSMGVRLHLLLHQEVVDLLDILVQEIGLLDQSLEVDDTVEQASGNLTGHVSMGIVDREVDGVTDELQLLGAIG